MIKKKGALIVIFMIIIVAVVYFLFFNNQKEDDYCVDELNEKIKLELDESLSCEETEPCPPNLACTPKCWGGEIRLSTIPVTHVLQAKPGKSCGMAIGIKNIFNMSADFRYIISIDDLTQLDRCGYDEETANELILGREHSFTLEEDETF